MFPPFLFFSNKTRFLSGMMRLRRLPEREVRADVHCGWPRVDDRASGSSTTGRAGDQPYRFFAKKDKTRNAQQTGTELAALDGHALCNAWRTGLLPWPLQVTFRTQVRSGQVCK